MEFKWKIKMEQWIATIGKGLWIDNTLEKCKTYESYLPPWEGPWGLQYRDSFYSNNGVTMVKNFLLSFSRGEKDITCYEHLNGSRRNMDSQRKNSTA